MTRLLGLIMLLATALARAEEPLPTIAEKTEGMTAVTGLIDFYVDHRTGSVWLRVPPVTGARAEVARFLYAEGLLTGMGANAVGLDRGKIGNERIISLRRVGGRLLVEELNLRFRALSDSDDERRAVEQSFATSVLWSGSFAAMDEDGTALVDWTSFIVRDAHGVADAMRRTEQGEFTLDTERSVADLDAILSFPDNVEFEAILTFASDKPGAHVRATAPTRMP